MTTCRIQWIDENGKRTPDSNEAIGYVYLEAYRQEFSGAVNGYIDHARSEDYPICAEHAKQLSEPDMHHWVFVPFEKYDPLDDFNYRGSRYHY